ncbi:phage holin family protein [Arthrobacter gandavensis]|uniref:phage holin family protein n=1 Tax=Arthrobacter gandavensis TaxID=169960 RepID=UPI001E48840D|nr:phage holin family protein [Arthrobacter gandavensis]
MATANSNEQTGAEPMNSSASTRTQRANGSSSLAGLTKVMARLLPRQVSDELSLAMAEMKQKGIKAGVAAAFVVVALLFLAALGVALIAAAILGLATVMPAWLAALLVAALFLVIAAIAALVGVNRFKKTMPLVPEDALRGIRYDLGVLKEGRSFDPATLDAPKKPKEQKPEDGKQEKPEDAVQKPTPEELRIRLRQRREHIAAVRDGLGEKADVRKQMADLKARRAAGRRNGTAGSGAHQEEGLADEVGAMFRERRQPLAVLGASLLAMGILLRRLLRK